MAFYAMSHLAFGFYLTHDSVFRLGAANLTRCAKRVADHWRPFKPVNCHRNRRLLHHYCVQRLIAEPVIPQTIMSMTLSSWR